MSRPKQANTKVHITATISPEAHKAIQNYRNDPRNWTKSGETTIIPTLSGIIQDCIAKGIPVYFPKAKSQPINTPASNNDIVSQQ